MSTADPLIRIENLSFRYPGATEDTLRNVNLEIERGDFVAVMGGNGAAKTTLCKTFNGLIPHYWSGDFAGRVEVDGVDTWESSVAALSQRVGYVYQDFQNQLVRPTVRDEIAFAPINFGLPDHEERVDAALELLGITALADRFVWQLSGGQAHRTALASVLAMEPQLIVVDEPAAELDPIGAEEVYRALERVNREHGVTVVTIEHHAEFVARYARSVVLMAHGAPVWHLPVREAMRRADDLAAGGIPVPQIVEAAQLLGIGETPCTVAEAVDAIGPLRSRAVPPDAAAAPAALPAPTTARAEATEPVARIRDLNHSIIDVTGFERPILRGIDLDLHAGERIALVGGNGAGKTTLLRMLAGIVVARSGDVTIGATSTRKHSARAFAEQVAYLAQHPELMFLTGSVRDDVALHPRSRRVPDAAERVEEVLERVRLLPFAERDGRTLSGGQQRRATLAIGLAMRPRILLLDEPTSSLDAASRASVYGMLDELAHTIECTVVATHDMQLVAEWATRVIVLEQGTVLADTSARELFGDAQLLERARLAPPQISRLGLALSVDPLPLDADELVSAVRADRLRAASAQAPATKEVAR